MGARGRIPIKGSGCSSHMRERGSALLNCRQLSRHVRSNIIGQRIAICLASSAAIICSASCAYCAITSTATAAR